MDFRTLVIPSEQIGVSMTTRIRIKIGEVEIECEGDPQFLKDDLPALVGAVAAAYGEVDPATPIPATQSLSSTEQVAVVGTTNSLAQTLSLTKGKKLMLAAALKLFFVDGKTSFTRDDINTEAKTANLHYKKTSQGKNWKSYVDQLSKDGELNEVSNGNFSLPGGKVESWMSQLD